MLIAYIWNTWGKLPSEIYNLPPAEKELVFQATAKRIEAEAKESKKR